MFERLRAVHGDRLQVLEFDGLPYARLRDDHRHLPRGTVFFPSGRWVAGYPHIGRIMALESGLRAQFQAPVWAEEKINGYNVRLVCEQGRWLALTRGGFVCGFTTHRLPDLLDLTPVEEDWVVCAEVAGAENPYLSGHPPDITEDVRLFVFDLMPVGRAGFLSHEEKRVRVAQWGLPAVPCFGRFALEDTGALAAILEALDARGREGVVFKEDSLRDKRAKYVTASASLDDIGVNSANLMELPPEYFTSRVLRLALFLADREQAVAARAGALGQAFLGGLAEMIRRFREEGQAYVRYRCRFRDPSVARGFFQELRARTGRQVRLREVGLEADNGFWVLTFDRVPSHINGLLNQLLSGGLVFD